MEIIEISEQEYAKIFPVPYHVFNVAAFNSLNSYKCAHVWYLLFKDSKPRLGLILGINEDTASSPFSAPFGGFTFIDDHLHQQHLDMALDLLYHFLTAKSIHTLKMALPPLCYDHFFLPKMLNSMKRCDYRASSVELNYVFFTSSFDENYENMIPRNARKNLHIALKQNLQFNKTSDVKSAYEIIAINRASRGFPLRMTFEQLEATTKIIKCDAFTVEHEQTIVASAIVYHVAQDIVQVVYWGDIPDYSSMKTMNFLSYKVFEYYKNTGIRIVDIGPSTENGKPNFGLCEFKESIGCTIELKLVFEKEILDIV